MSGIMDLLNSDIGKKLISGASKESGASEEKTSSVLGMAMPLLLGAMKNNAQSPQGAASLMSALSGKHNGSILDNLGSLLGGGSVDDSVKQDGEGILGHILGGKKSVVEQGLAEKSGLDAGSVSQILKVAAPVLLGFLGKKNQESDGQESGGIASLLGSLMGNQGDGNQNMLESFLDKNGDGNVMDDLAGMLGGSKNKKGGGGGLGGLFGG